MSSTTTITLCMGSSCFSRGNGKNLPRVQQVIREHALDARIALRGCRCGGCCSGGPNIWVDGVLFPDMTPAHFDAYLDSFLLGQTHGLAPTPNS